MTTQAAVARKWGWRPSVTSAGFGFLLICAVTLGTLVAGWAAPSGIVLGFALGLGWGTVLELPTTVMAAAESGSSEDGSNQAPIP